MSYTTTERNQLAIARVEQEPRFVLELTEEEAREVLATLSESTRKDTYDVYVALLDVWESQE